MTTKAGDPSGPLMICTLVGVFIALLHLFNIDDFNAAFPVEHHSVVFYPETSATNAADSATAAQQQASAAATAKQGTESARDAAQAAAAGAGSAAGLPLASWKCREIPWSESRWNPCGLV
jgi:hypothetical protein